MADRRHRVTLADQPLNEPGAMGRQRAVDASTIHLPHHQ
jgi:hypothetical protein